MSIFYPLLYMMSIISTSISIVLSLIVSIASPLATYAALETIDSSNPLINTDLKEVVNTDDLEGKNPLRAGSRLPVESPDNTTDIGVISEKEIVTYTDGQLQTIQYVKNIVNYALGFTALISVIYLIYVGFQIVTAGEDEEKYKEGLSRLRVTFYAVGGIAVSWFLVSFIFYVVTQIVK